MLNSHYGLLEDSYSERHSPSWLQVRFLICISFFMPSVFMSERYEQRQPQAYISATWTCPTRASTTFPAEQESCRVTVQNCTAAFMSYTMNCMSLVGQCRRGGAKAAILCSFPAKPGLNSQWKFKWLQELQKKPSSTLERRPYPRGLISFYKRQIWDARKWTKPTFAKGMKKQKQVVK